MARSSMALQRGSARLHSLAQLTAQFHAGTSAEATQTYPKQAVANPATLRVQNRCRQNEAVSADGGALPIVGWTPFLDLALARPALSLQRAMLARSTLQDLRYHICVLLAAFPTDVALYDMHI